MIECWSGTSSGLAPVLYGGAESAAIVTLRATTRRIQLAGGAVFKESHPVTGTIIVGKNIGERPEKYLELQGPSGKLRFDLATGLVTNGSNEWIVGLQSDWAYLLINQVLHDKVPSAAQRFRPDRAGAAIAFLERWRDRCQQPVTDKATGVMRLRNQPSYAAGTTWDALKTSKYQT